MKVFCSFCIFFCKSKAQKTQPRFRLLVFSLQADVGKDAQCSCSGRCREWRQDTLGPHCPQHGDDAPARMRAGDGSTVSPRVGTNPSKGRGCSFQRGAVVQGVSGCLGTGSTKVGEILPKLMPISCSTMELPQGLERLIPVSTAVSPFRSWSVLLLCFEALSSWGESC